MSQKYIVIFGSTFFAFDVNIEEASDLKALPLAKAT
jgi:hypothetical protein